jgi:hypothetical protein
MLVRPSLGACRWKCYPLSPIFDVPQPSHPPLIPPAYVVHARTFMRLVVRPTSPRSARRAARLPHSRLAAAVHALPRHTAHTVPTRTPPRATRLRATRRVGRLCITRQTTRRDVSGASPGVACLAPLARAPLSIAFARGLIGVRKWGHIAGLGFHTESVKRERTCIA